MIPRSRSAIKIAAAGFAGLLGLSACGDWKPDTAELTARTAEPAQGANCSSCHGYPLQDTNHVFHLYHTTPNKRFNGPITCLDCHFQALQHASVVLRDSVYVDPTDSMPGHWSSLDFPIPGTDDSLARLIRTFDLDTVVLRPQNRPIPLPKRPGAFPNFTEYMTGLAHMNRKVDVEFDPKVTDVVRFGGEKAAFNPREETCSAVACHPGDTPFRFAAPGKGLPELPPPDQASE
ncbi:MAG: hypothetical protein JWP91_1724 [Fibrobacteres bacterium]|nr:hypothetical protein [Fibrobacterota bacterium]